MKYKVFGAINSVIGICCLLLVLYQTYLTLLVVQNPSGFTYLEGTIDKTSNIIRVTVFYITAIGFSLYNLYLGYVLLTKKPNKKYLKFSLIPIILTVIVLLFWAYFHFNLLISSNDGISSYDDLPLP